VLGQFAGGLGEVEPLKRLDAPSWNCRRSLRRVFSEIRDKRQIALWSRP
jgi:hypothetical protein